MQPTLIAALGLDLVRAAWLEARRDVEGAGAEGLMAPLHLQHQQAPPLPADAAGRRFRSQDGGGVEEERRVRPRLARQETVMWRAGEEMPRYHAPPDDGQAIHGGVVGDSVADALGGDGCPHLQPEPRPDEHHPRCPFYAPRGELQQEQQEQEQQQQHEGEGEAVEVEEGVDAEAAAAEEGEYDDEEEEKEEEYGEEDEDYEEEEDDLASMTSTVTAAAMGVPALRVQVQRNLAPVALLLAKDDPEEEDEDFLQEGAPDGFLWCVLWCVVCPVCLSVCLSGRLSVCQLTHRPTD